MVDKSHALSVRKQCEILGISRSCQYYCPRENAADSEIMNRISEINHTFPCYGYRRIHWYLCNKDGYKINRKKVQRLMKMMGIRAIFPGPRTSIPGTDSVFPYLLKGLAIERPNQVWAVDITYIKLPVGMVYLFAIIDWHSRFIVGHILVNTMEAGHGVTVLKASFINGLPEICNSDQGSQFTCPLWLELLVLHGIKVSHDGVGRCIDNVRIERFWRTVKYENIFLQSYNNMTDARRGIKEFVDYYNHDRPHQSLGYKTPGQIYAQGKSGGLSPPPEPPLGYL